MQFDFNEMSPSERYFLLTQTIIPRPIAWILTKNSVAKYNLAPFSFFAPVCSEPPTLVVSIGNKTNGSAKDTYANLAREGDCVLHIASVEQAEGLNASAASLPECDSEIEQLGLDLTRFVPDGLPRLSQPSIAMHCRLQQTVELGAGPQRVAFLTVEGVYVDDSVLVQVKDRHQVSSNTLDPLARLGGKEYSGLSNHFELDRPD